MLQRLRDRTVHISGWLFLLLFVAATTWFAAASADESPELAILAGVIVGSAVTAAVTWILGPKVEQRVRRESRKEQALTDILDILLKDRGYKDVLSVTDDLSNDTVAALATLERLTTTADQVRLLAVAAGDVAFLRLCERWRSSIYDARFVVKLVPLRTPDENTANIELYLGGVFARNRIINELTDVERERVRLSTRSRWRRKRF